MSCSCLQEQLETEAMRAGTRIHAELEAQTTTLVEVHVDTWEDFWAVSGRAGSS
jgi:Exonuclease V - a 5' deoxyribonuclease